VKIEKAGDLMFMTYYMIDWKKVRQESSEVRCADCGRQMNRAEPAIDSKGQRFDGYVCHDDKSVIWVKAS